MYCCLIPSLLALIVEFIPQRANYYDLSHRAPVVINAIMCNWKQRGNKDLQWNFVILPHLFSCLIEWVIKWALSFLFISFKTRLLSSTTGFLFFLKENHLFHHSLLKIAYIKYILGFILHCLQYDAFATVRICTQSHTHTEINCPLLSHLWINVSNFHRLESPYPSHPFKIKNNVSHSNNITVGELLALRSPKFWTFCKMYHWYHGSFAGWLQPVSVI